MGTVGSPNDYDITLSDGTTFGWMLVRNKDGNAEISGHLSPADRMQTLNVPWVYRDTSKGLGYSVRNSRGASDAEATGELSGFGYAENAYTFYDGWVGPSGALTELPHLGAALGTPTCLVEWQGDVIGVMEHGIFFNDGGTAATMTYLNGITPSTRTYGNAVVYGDYLMVAQRGSSGTNDGIVRYSSTLAETIDQDVLAYFLATAYWVVDDVGSYRLIRVNGPHLLSYLEDGGNPMTLADWITPAPSGIPVGSSAYAIRSLVTLDDVVWPIKAEGVFSVDEQQTARNKTPSWISQWDQVSGGASCAYEHGGVRGIAVAHGDGIVFVRVGNQGIETEMLWVDPAQTGSNNSPVLGRCYALMQYGRWLMAAIYNYLNDTTYIIRGRPNPSGDPPFVWFGAERVMPGQIVRAMMVHTPSVGSDFQPRIWYAGQSTSTQAPIYSWQYLPRAASPLSEVAFASAFRFETNWSIVWTGNDWNQPGSKKIPMHVNLLGDNLGSGRSLALSVSTDEGAFASVDAITTSPGAEFDTTIPAGYVHTFRVDGVGTDTTPAIFKSMTIEANIAKKQSGVYQIPIILGPANRSGASLVSHESEWAKFMEAVQAGQEVTLYDPMHRRLSVVFDPNIDFGYREQTYKGNAHSPRQWVRTATLRYLIREEAALWDEAIWDQSLYSVGD